MSDFSERLSYLLAGRKLFPWVMATGASRGAAETIKKDKTPGPDILRLIRLRECVSIGWLIAGDGAPFILEPCHQSDELISMLPATAHSQSASAELYLLTDGQRLVVMTSTPGAYEYKGRMIEYSHRRLIPVSINDETASVLRHYQQQCPQHAYMEYPLTGEQMDALWRGYMGPFQLLGDEQKPLVEIPFRPITSIDTLFQTLMSHLPQEQTTPLSTHLMRSVIQCVDTTALEEGIHLDTDQRARVYTAIYRHAQRAGVTADQLDSNSIVTALELR